MILRIILFIILIYSNTYASTYYIDWNNGSDTNNGTSKDSPWKHAPGMQGCLYTDANNNNCRARTHSSTSGDTFILKGGVTWPHAALSWDWTFGNSTTFTVDQTWYSGDSWTRPVLDSEGQEPTASPYSVVAMMRAYGNNMVVDNIEFKGLPNNYDGTVIQEPRMLSINGSGNSGGEVKNCYFHGWSHGGTATHDNMIIVVSPYGSQDLTLKIHHNVFDGSDTTKDMACAYKGSAGHFYNNYVGYMQNGFIGISSLYVWGNTFEEIATTRDFDLTAHHQSYEQNTGQSIIYNNFIKNSAGGATIITYSIDGKKDYIFNNVIIGDRNQALQLGTKNGGSITLITGVDHEMYVFNNTIQTDSDITLYPISGPSLTDAALMPLMVVRNNHLIGYRHSVNFKDGVLESGKIESNNLGTTEADAFADGYSNGSIVPYYPTSIYGSSINSGYGMGNVCDDIPSLSPSNPADDCKKDSTVGVVYNSTSHSVEYPNRQSIERYVWDVGAYEYFQAYFQRQSSGAISGGGSIPTP